jgi:hypothetical protein
MGWLTTPWGQIFQFDPSKARFETFFGGENLNFIDFHHQKRFESWN